MSMSKINARSLFVLMHATEMLLAGTPLPLNLRSEVHTALRNVKQVLEEVYFPTTT